MSRPRKQVTIKAIFHALIALAGWALFIYWWNRVIPQIDSRDAAVALVFIGATVLATVLVTLLWIRYNIGIFRRKGPRTRLVRAAENRETDFLGRTIVRSGPLKTASLVVVSVDGKAKKFEARERALV